MVTIKPLKEELAALGLLQGSSGGGGEKREIFSTRLKERNRKKWRHILARMEDLSYAYRTGKKPLLSEERNPKDRIRRLFEELEELVDDTEEAPEGDQARKVMKDVEEIAEAVLQKYGKKYEVREVFEAVRETARALRSKLVEMDEYSSEKEVKKVVSGLVDALEWLIEEFEAVKGSPLQYGDPESPGERMASSEPDRSEVKAPELSSSKGAGSMLERKRR